MKYSKYPSYRDSGTVWLGKIPSEWLPTRLKYCLSSIVAGGTPKTTNDEYWTESGDGTPWVSIADMTKNDIITETKKDVTLDGILEKNLKVLPEGTILYSIFASLGKVAFAGTPLTTNQAILGLVPNTKIDKAFFYWVLVALEGYVKFTASSNTQDNLNSEKVSNFPVSLPLQEQKTIANYLDKATGKIDTLIAKQTRLIELLKEKRQAVISTAVTRGLDSTVPMKDSGVEWLGEIPEHWEVKKLKYIIKSIESGTSVNASDQPATVNDYGVLKTSCVYNENFRYEENKTVIYDEKGRVSCPLKANTLIVSRMNTPDLVGAAGFVREAPTNIFLPDRLWQVSFVDSNPKFIHYLTLTNTYRGYIHTVCAGTSSSMQNLSQDDFKNFTSALPPISEQESIVEYINHTTSKIDTLIAKATKAIDLLKEKRTALISAAVTGKIDVRNAS